MRNSSRLEFTNYDGDRTIFESMRLGETGHVEITYEVNFAETLELDPRVVLTVDFPLDRLDIVDKATGNVYKLKDIEAR